MSGDDRRLRILGFEPFNAGSHRAVRTSISRHSRHAWTWFTRPGRAWKWRMRLAAMELHDQARASGALDQPFDVVFATSLMSLADLRALMAKAGHADARFILYMHENQAAYPAGHATESSHEWDANYALTNLTSVLAADRVIFNSAWNRASFIDGVEELLARAPDPALKNVRRNIERASTVIWPPVELPPEDVVTAPKPTDGAIRIAWPHRWEHDKGPDELLEIAESYSETFDLRWTILGERYRAVPDALEHFRRRLEGRVDHMGFVEDRAEYWRHLARCDWVLSTARHEFFGIAVVEAMLAGCLPWLPDRLSYPELLPEVARGLSPLNPPAVPEAVRSAIRMHLEPALAPNAVARLDEEIARAVHV